MDGGRHGQHVVAWCRSPVAGTWLAGEGVLDRSLRPASSDPQNTDRTPTEHPQNTDHLTKEDSMAWDFSTEPEFEEKLEWMRTFVRQEVFPLETLSLTYDQVRVVIRPLQARVKEQGLWAAHLPPELGGMGFGRSGWD